MLDHRLVADHCVALSENDISLLAENQVKVVHNPESNMKLASGIAPVPRLLESGITVALGTDGCASNNNLDMFGEMDMCAKLHKAATLDPTVLTAETALRMATGSGARALGWGGRATAGVAAAGGGGLGGGATRLAERRDLGGGWEGRTGQIAPTMLADLIVVDFRKPHLTPVYNPVSHLVYAAGAADVRHSVIGGRLMMKDHILLTLDLEEIFGHVREFAKKNRG